MVCPIRPQTSESVTTDVTITITSTEGASAAVSLQITVATPQAILSFIPVLLKVPVHSAASLQNFMSCLVIMLFATFAST